MDSNKWQSFSSNNLTIKFSNKQIRLTKMIQKYSSLNRFNLNLLKPAKQLWFRLNQKLIRRKQLLLCLRILLMLVLRFKNEECFHQLDQKFLEKKYLNANSNNKLLSRQQEIKLYLLLNKAHVP